MQWLYRLYVDIKRISPINLKSTWVCFPANSFFLLKTILGWCVHSAPRSVSFWPFFSSSLEFRHKTWRHKSWCLERTGIIIPLLCCQVSLRQLIQDSCLYDLKKVNLYFWRHCTGILQALKEVKEVKHLVWWLSCSKVLLTDMCAELNMHLMALLFHILWCRTYVRRRMHSLSISM